MGSAVAEITRNETVWCMRTTTMKGVYCSTAFKIDWPQSLMSIFFSKTDNLSKIAIYKLYLEVEILGLDIREDRIFRR